MRKVIACLWCVLLFCLQRPLFAAADEELTAQLLLSVSANGAVPGQEVTVTLRTGAFSPGCSSLIALPGKLSIAFDAGAFELLDYQAGSAAGFSPTQLPDDTHSLVEGHVSIRQNEGVGPDTGLVSFRFRVLDADAGSYAFHLSSRRPNGITPDGQSVRMQTQDAALSVLPAPSADNTLHSLSVPGFSLRPGFDPFVSTFTVNVPAYVADVGIQYTAHEKASVVLHGDSHSLAEGDNGFTLTVTAENGSRRVYTLIIHREPQSTGSKTNPSRPAPSTGTSSVIGTTGSASSADSTVPAASTTSAAASGIPFPTETGCTAVVPGASASRPDATGPQPTTDSSSSAFYWLLIPAIALLIAGYLLVVHFTEKRDAEKQDKDSGPDDTEPPAP